MVKDGYGVCYAVTPDQYVSSYLTVLSTLYIYNARMVLDRLSLLGLDGDSLLSSCDW